jgi:uncharacterized protein YktB (UPF0637 family)
MTAHNIANHHIYQKQSIQKDINDRNLIHKEQKVCCRGSKVCKGQLLITKAILQESKNKKKNACLDRLSERF